MNRNYPRKNHRRIVLLFILAIQIFSWVMIVGFFLGKIKIHSRLPYLVIFSLGIVLFFIIEGNKNKIIRFSYLTCLMLTTIILSLPNFYQPKTLPNFTITELFNNNPLREEITLPLLTYLKKYHPGQKFIISEDLYELFPEKEFLIWTEANRVSYEELKILTGDQIEKLGAIALFDIGPIFDQHFYVGIDHDYFYISDTIYILSYSESIYVLPNSFFENDGN